MGLRYSEDVVSHLLEGVLDMQESTMYQAILRRGRLTGEHQVLIRQGTRRFGKANTEILAAIEAIQDIERLEALCERILDLDVHDWNRSVNDRSRSKLLPARRSRIGPMPFTRPTRLCTLLGGANSTTFRPRR